jgi:hypothetical protein
MILGLGVWVLGWDQMLSITMEILNFLLITSFKNYFPIVYEASSGQGRKNCKFQGSCPLGP